MNISYINIDYKSFNLYSMFGHFECSIIGPLLLVKGKLISVFPKIPSDTGNILLLKDIETSINELRYPDNDQKHAFLDK